MARWKGTAKQRAALRKAQLASARKRRGKKGRKANPKVKRSAGRAFVAGLALGQSKTLNRRAGLYAGNRSGYTKSGEYDRRHGPRKKKVRRVGGYVAGVYTTALVASVATGGLHAYANRRASKKYGLKAYR
jgi:hypothetical protein